MGNSAYKREQARIHNENRAYMLEQDAKRKADMEANPEKYGRKGRRGRGLNKAQAFISAAAVMGVGYGLQNKRSKRRGAAISTPTKTLVYDEPPVKVSTWKELAAVVGEGDFKLRITPEKGNGWIIPKEAETEEDADFELVEYLSTHTFYGSEYKRSTELLQKYGFNVELSNWDKR